MCFYLQNLCVNHAVLSFFSFLCENLLLEKCAQSLCEMTAFLCANLIDPKRKRRHKGALEAAARPPLVTHLLARTCGFDSGPVARVLRGLLDLGGGVEPVQDGQSVRGPLARAQMRPAEGEGL